MAVNKELKKGFVLYKLLKHIFNLINPKIGYDYGFIGTDLKIASIMLNYDVRKKDPVCFFSGDFVFCPSIKHTCQNLTFSHSEKIALYSEIMQTYSFENMLKHFDAAESFVENFYTQRVNKLGFPEGFYANCVRNYIPIVRSNIINLSNFFENHY